MRTGHLSGMNPFFTLVNYASDSDNLSSGLPRRLFPLILGGAREGAEQNRTESEEKLSAGQGDAKKEPLRKMSLNFHWFWLEIDHFCPLTFGWPASALFSPAAIRGAKEKQNQSKKKYKCDAAGKSVAKDNCCSPSDIFNPIRSDLSQAGRRRLTFSLAGEDEAHLAN